MRCSRREGAARAAAARAAVRAAAAWGLAEKV